MLETRTRACLAAGVLFALVAGASLQAQETPPPGGGQQRGTEQRPDRGSGRGARPAGDAPANLEGAMKGMKRAMKALEPNIADATKRDDNLKALNDMERNCISAKGMPLPSDVMKSVTDPAARAKLAVDFRADMMKLARSLLDVEQSVIDGKGEQAKTQLTAIIKMRDDAHKAMGIKDE